MIFYLRKTAICHQSEQAHRRSAPLRFVSLIAFELMLTNQNESTFQHESSIVNYQKRRRLIEKIQLKNCVDRFNWRQFSVVTSGTERL